MRIDACQIHKKCGYTPPRPVTDQESSWGEETFTLSREAKGNEMDQPTREPAKVRLIGIVSASGGLQALPEILGSLPREFPVPILVLQKMLPDHLKHLADLLGEKCLLQVTVPEDGGAGAGHHVASDDLGLVVAQGRLVLERGNPDCKRVTANALFRSMARDVGSGAMAVILTGMGYDGAEGMKEVRDAGGYTIVQCVRLHVGRLW